MAKWHDYESLGPEIFQQLCQAVVVRHFPHAQCFPVGMPDGGKDISVSQGKNADATVFQVKFRRPTANKLARPGEIAKWMTDVLAGELPKVEALASHGTRQYVLITNAQCSSHAGVGTRDRVQAWLSENFPIPAQVWWRDDLDRRLDPEVEIKREYGLIRDMTGLAELLGLKDPDTDEESFIKLARGDQRLSALMKYMSHQYERDRFVKFKQAELEPQLLDVFIDVPLIADSAGGFLVRASRDVRLGASRHRLSNQPSTLDKWTGLLSKEVTSAFKTSNRASGALAASFLLSKTWARRTDPSTSRIVIEGAPGQGKSTVGQYVCQVHRARLLNSPDLHRFALEHTASPVRLPFHIDFRDLAKWLRREDPFDVKNSGMPEGWAEPLEAFLSAQVRRFSGGMQFSVTDLDAVLRATPVILILDGLDEVPDLNDRRAVVACVNEALNRIEPFSPSFRTVATSRPSSFSKTPGFSKREYSHLTLGDLPLPLALEYTDGWLKSRNVSHQAAHEIRAILGQKLGQPHIVELARNPMQLAILLWLVRKKGPSLPDKRTALYRDYMDTFLDREAEKSQIIRDERELILDLHGYVAWELHCLAEIGSSNGSISEPKLKAMLKNYLQLRGYKKRKLELVDQLFNGMTDRVMVLTSRVQNTFEFEVQPLREYFAAKYLHSTARMSVSGAEQTGNRSDRFEALLRNPYWWNVTRFYAGFSDVGELANLVDLMEELIKSESDFSLIAYSREVALTLLRDQVFSQKPRSVSRVVDLISTEGAIALLGAKAMRSPDSALPVDSGGEEIADRMMMRIEKGIASGIPDFDAARLLDANCSGVDVGSWWFDRWTQARDVRTRRLWVGVGRAMDSFGTLPPANAVNVIKAMSDDLNFWHIAIPERQSSYSFLRNENFSGFLNALRSGVLVDMNVERSELGLPWKCASLASIEYFSFAVVDRRSDYIPWPDLLTFEQDSSAVSEVGDYEDLHKALAKALALSPRRRGDSRYELWVDFFDAFTDALGGPCRRTFVLAAVLGGIRNRNLSHRAAGELNDESVSPVLRARYARQRGADRGWWGEQVRNIKKDDDAFFVLCCMLRWAPLVVLMDNSRLLESWVRKFDVYTLKVIRSATSRLWSEKKDPEPDRQWPSRTSARMLYLGSAKMPPHQARAELAAIARTCRDRDLAQLSASTQLELISDLDIGKLDTALDEIANAYLIARGSVLYASDEYYETKVDTPIGRDCLRRVTEIPESLRFYANDTVTSAVARDAVTLAKVAAEDEWFDQNTLD